MEEQKRNPAQGLSESEQVQVRRQKLADLQAAGNDPFTLTKFPQDAYSADLKEEFKELPNETDSGKQVALAGRMMSKRVMGKASFAHLRDDKGDIQLYVRRDELGEEAYAAFKKLDVGDIIGVKGEVFRTKTGELSVRATELTLLAKSLRPLPEKFHGLTDTEMRYRQRYVDLIANPEVKDTFIKRAKIIATMREYFNNAGCLEVETPILQSIPGGATARPFITHHNALDIPLYLRIANELYLKRLIVGGYDGVYEFAKDFRNEGMDKTHNPEFTCMEIYVAYKDYIWMMEFIENLLEKIATNLYGKTTVMNEGVEIDFKAPYKKIGILDAIKEYAGVDVKGMDVDQLRETCKKLNVEIEPSMGVGKLIDAIFGEYCEKHFVQPTFVTDYPVEMSPLTKRHRNDPTLTERFELFVCGHELANAYSELNDPIDQRERFEEQAKLKSNGDDEAMFIDYDFLRALEYGMPPTSGLGMGIDRLTMLMTGNTTIQDVLFFPQMRPEKMPSKQAEEKDSEENNA